MKNRFSSFVCYSSFAAFSDGDDVLSDCSASNRLRVYFIRPISFHFLKRFENFYWSKMEFEWIGDPISVDIEDRQLTTKPKTFYT